MQGLHLTADLYGCRCRRDLLIDAIGLATMCAGAVANAGLTLVDEKFHVFPDYQGQPGGVTGALLLAESHLAVHTWPERDGVTLDVYVCNFSTDNSSKAEQLMDALIIEFAPQRMNTNRILRGSVDPDTQSDELLLEWLNRDSAYGFRVSRRLETLKSAHQTIEVFDTPQFGKLFRLDGAYMTSERDEFFYHEPLVHCAALAHPAPRRALIIGGGDGGSSEEMLKHPCIESVVVAELDPMVVDIARRHLQTVHHGAFDDPRLTLVFGDGLAYAREHDARFDLIVLDLTDPDTPAQQLYTREFFTLLRERLAPGGAITLHIGSPVFTPERVRHLLAELSRVFDKVAPLGLYIPLYGAYWAMAVASMTLDPREVDARTLDDRLRERAIGDLEYYNPAVHHALFAMPNFVQRLLPGADAGAAR